MILFGLAFSAAVCFGIAAVAVAYSKYGVRRTDDAERGLVGAPRGDSLHPAVTAEG